MKKTSIAILVLLAVIASCKKTPEVNLQYVDVERDLITVGTTTATVQCDYKYITTLKKAYFYYGEGENEADMNTAEMRVVQNTLYVDLTGLKENTTYSYYYEFVNGFNSMRTEAKTFKTETGNGGGDEPPTPPSGVPEGAINGLFTINANGDKVFFAQGNLQYQASTNTWRFAEQQWDYVGDETLGTVNANDMKSDNSLISPTYNGWIDLFGWGTSGWNSGANCYQPWSTSTDTEDYLPEGYENHSLIGDYANADWGFYNSIINGGNQSGRWRTPIQEEYDYVFNYRNTLSGIRFVKAVVNDVNGAILFPDNWDNSYYVFNNTNQVGANFADNVLSESQWNTIEQYGVVFLPAAGYRDGTWINHINTNGDYWAASSYDSWFSWGVEIDDFIFCGTDNDNLLLNGRSVRLIQDAR